MKIYAINGSPRKKWNSALLLESFINGVKSVEPDAEVKLINVYDYNFTGCRSCFGCKLKTNPVGVCAIRDEIYELLQDVRTSDRKYVLATNDAMIKLCCWNGCF